jgi:hypothetical protein
MLSVEEKAVMDNLLKGEPFYALSKDHRKIANLLKSEGIITSFSFILNTKVLDALKAC